MRSGAHAWVVDFRRACEARVLVHVPAAALGTPGRAANCPASGLKNAILQGNFTKFPFASEDLASRFVYLALIIAILKLSTAILKLSNGILSLSIALPSFSTAILNLSIVLLKLSIAILGFSIAVLSLSITILTPSIAILSPSIVILILSSAMFQRPRRFTPSCFFALGRRAGMSNPSSTSTSIHTPASRA